MDSKGKFGGLGQSGGFDEGVGGSGELVDDLLVRLIKWRDSQVGRRPIPSRV